MRVLGWHTPCLALLESHLCPSIAQDHRALALPGGMLMSARHRPPLSLGCEAPLLTFDAISPCFSPFSVPLSLSRTFAVSRTEVLAAGSPGNSACFLFVTPGKPGHQGRTTLPVSCSLKTLRLLTKRGLSRKTLATEG